MERHLLPRSLRICLLGAMLGMATCAARRPQLDTPDLIQRAEALAETSRSEAISLLEDYLAGKTDPALEPWAMIWAGEQRRLQGDTARARSWFEAVAERHPAHPMKEAALLGMAVIDAGSEPSGNTLATLQLLKESGVPDTLNADRYRLLARVAADDGSPPSKVRELVRKAVTYAEADEAVRLRVHQTLGDLLSPEQSTALTGIEVSSAANAEEETYQRALAALKGGAFPEAIQLSQRFLEAWPDSPRAREVGYFIKRAEKGDRVSSRKVGVLLPLSGKYAPAAQRFQEVIQFANQQEGSPLTLVFADTQGDPARAVAELERLTLDEGCVAILGPLLKETGMPAAEAAQALHIPMIALSQSSDPTSAGDYIYRGFLPIEQQVEALLKHAVSDRGFRRFAVLYPQNDYGLAARDAFEQEALKQGAQVVRKQSYDPEAKVFLQPARALGAKSGGGRPTIDYDALFIPDNHQRVALVASALAYEEFPVGTFRPHGGPGLPLLGLNAWNNPLLVEAGGQYVRGSVFVDAFLPSDESPAIQRFVGSYQDAYRRPPSVIDAVTYDATRFLARAAKASTQGRDGVRDQLKEIRLPDPVGAGARFGADREVDRSLLVLMVTSSGIRPWQPGG